MNPARSWERMTCFPRASRANASARTAVASVDIREVTSSTSGSTGTGLKKWIPTTWPGRLVAIASFMMGIDDVLEARMASGFETTLSRSSKTWIFSASDSTTASTTRSHWSSDPMSVLKATAAIADRASSSVSFPDRVARSSDASIRDRPASSLAESSSTTPTRRPALAHASAMPDPIWPQPTTPTRSIAVCTLTHSSPFPDPPSAPSALPLQLFQSTMSLHFNSLL